MVSEENIIEVDFASLILVDEVTIRIVDGVESKAGQVHGYEIEVHAFDARWGEEYLLRLKF